MSLSLPRIAIPEPTSADHAYNDRSWPEYAHAVEAAGGIPVPIPLNESPSTLARIISGCSGVLLPGSGADVDPERYGQPAIPECGPKDPAREAADELLLQDAFNLHKPVFGICYGLQSLNVWRNGTLLQHLVNPGAPTGGSNGAVNHRPGREVRDAHQVVVAGDSRLARIFSHAADPAGDTLSLSVNSSHHQAIDQPGDQLDIVAKSPQDGCIEALEGLVPGHFVLGVQWHPERTYDGNAASRALFGAFLDAAREWRPRPIQESVAP